MMVAFDLRLTLFAGTVFDKIRIRIIAIPARKRVEILEQNERNFSKFRRIRCFRSSAFH